MGGVAKVHAPVFCGKQSVLIELHQSGVILDHRDNIVDHVMCLKAEFLWHTSFPRKMASSTHMVYIHTLIGRYVF